MGDNKKSPNYGILLLMLPLYLLILTYIVTPLVVGLKNNLSQESMFKDTPVNTSQITTLYKSPNQIINALKDTNTLHSVAIVIGIISIFLIILIILLKTTDLGEGQSGIHYLKDNGTQGTANWLSNKEAKKIVGIGVNKGLVFGTVTEKNILGGETEKMVTLLPESFLNKNIAIFGASGTMKSRFFVRPNIMQISEIGQSMIITDPKGELFESMSQFLSDRGYTVRVLNLVNMINSDRWNPLGEVTDDISAQSFTETVMANTKAPGAKADEFWDKTETNLLKALALYVVKENPPEERNLAAVYSMLALNDAATINATFRRLPVSHPAKMPYNIYSQASENVRTGVVIGLGSKLQVFQNKLVQDMTSVSDIDLTLPKREKCAYFCITSDMQSTFDFIAGLFFSFLFIKLTSYADYAPKEGQKDVYFILDEFPNIGAIPDFTKKISTMRSRGISSQVIFQNIAQLKNRYPNDAWAEIIGNCDSRLFLGATDIVTAEFVSKLLGQTTVQDVSQSKQAGFEGIWDYGKVTTKATKRNLMNPDEILRLPHENAILILRGQKPLMLNKMDYTKHRLSKYMEPISVSDYKVPWAQDYYDALEQNKPLEEIIEEKSSAAYAKLKNDDISKNETDNDISDNKEDTKDKVYEYETKKVTHKKRTSKRKELPNVEQIKFEEPKKDNLDNDVKTETTDNKSDFW